MVKIIIVPKDNEDVFKLLVLKEKEGHLQTFYRTDKKKKGEDKWLHKGHQGYIKLHQCGGGICVALLSSEAHWQIFQAFIGLLLRQLKDAVGTISIDLE